MCVRPLEDGNEEVDEQDVRHNEIDGHDGGHEPIAGGARAVLFTVVSCNMRSVNELAVKH